MKATIVLLAIAASMLFLAAMPTGSGAQEACTPAPCVATITPPTVTAGRGGSLFGADVGIEVNWRGDPTTLDINGPDITGMGNPDDFVMTPPTITGR